jgi:hypothetical protein
VTIDFDGNPRVMPYDIGAFEFNASGPAPQTFDFGLTNPIVEEEEPRMIQGASTNVTITVTKLQGTAATVSFSTTPLPTGVTAEFSPTSCTPTVSTCTTVLTVDTANATPAGGYDAIIQGQSGSLTRTTRVPFRVTCN